MLSLRKEKYWKHKNSNLVRKEEKRAAHTSKATRLQETHKRKLSTTFTQGNNHRVINRSKNSICLEREQVFYCRKTMCNIEFEIIHPASVKDPILALILLRHTQQQTSPVGVISFIASYTISHGEPGGHWPVAPHRSSRCHWTKIFLWTWSHQT